MRWSSALVLMLRAKAFQGRRNLRPLIILPKYHDCIKSRTCRIRTFSILSQPCCVTEGPKILAKHNSKHKLNAARICLMKIIELQFMQHEYSYHEHILRLPPINLLCNISSHFLLAVVLRKNLFLSLELSTLKVDSNMLPVPPELVFKHH